MTCTGYGVRRHVLANLSDRVRFRRSSASSDDCICVFCNRSRRGSPIASLFLSARGGTHRECLPSVPGTSHGRARVPVRPSIRRICGRRQNRRSHADILFLRRTVRVPGRNPSVPSTEATLRYNRRRHPPTLRVPTRRRYYKLHSQS